MKSETLKSLISDSEPMLSMMESRIKDIYVELKIESFNSILEIEDEDRKELEKEATKLSGTIIDLWHLADKLKRELQTANRFREFKKKVGKISAEQIKDVPFDAAFDNLDSEQIAKVIELLRQRAGLKDITSEAAPESGT